MGRLATLLATAIVLGLVLGVPASANPRLVTRTCVDDGVSELTSHGVKCRAAERIAWAAVRKSNCPPRPDFRGCYRTVKVGRWSCHGLFPGEGQSFTCRNGRRWLHSSGGG